MIRLFKAVGSLLLAGVLASCGGGGGSSGSTGTGTDTGTGTGTGTGGGTTTTAVASIDVFTSATELASASNSNITFTVLPKDANNQVIPSQAVSFSASSGSLTGALPAPTTGTDGTPITSVSLSPGADRSNRNITVTVSSGGLSKDVVVPVTGTAVTVTGDSFVAQGASTTLTTKAVDSSGAPIPNATLTVTSSLGNAPNPATLTTNSQGTATFTYTGVNAGNDTVTVTGLGSSVSTAIAVSANEFRFESPAASSSVAVGASQTLTVRFLQGGNPVVGAAVNFSTTRGTVNPASAVTDAQGRASTVVSSTSAGPANIVAQTGTSQVTLPLTFVATNPSTLVLQANPSAVPPNANGSTSSQATLTAQVRDASGNPVAGRVVTFTAESDPSSGSISPGTAVTDASGTATSIFIPGAITTANNGVVLRATVQGTAVTGTTSLTVNTQAVFINITTGNEITNLDPTTYQKDFAVQVVDVNGAPVANKVVSLSAVPDTYLKGTLVRGATSFDYNGTPTVCPNEDRNRNGSLDVGDDDNRNGRLEPGNPVSVSASSVTTGANGFATFSVFYGENFAPWVDVVISARTTVGGTESVKTQNYLLAGSAADFTATTPPAGVVSPFGTATSCTNPN